MLRPSLASRKLRVLSQLGSRRSPPASVLAFSVAPGVLRFPVPGRRTLTRSFRTRIMKNKKLNVEHIWKQFEDLLVPRLRLSVTDRAVYSHLLRHSRLEGKVRLRFSILWLARNIRLSGGPVREAVRRLAAQGALRLVERSKAGHVVEVRLPDEIRAVRLNRIESRAAAKAEGPGDHAAVNIEEADFLQNRTLRKAIH